MGVYEGFDYATVHLAVNLGKDFPALGDGQVWIEDLAFEAIGEPSPAFEDSLPGPPVESFFLATVSGPAGGDGLGIHGMNEALLKSSVASGNVEIICENFPIVSVGRAWGLRAG